MVAPNVFDVLLQAVQRMRDAQHYVRPGAPRAARELAHQLEREVDELLKCYLPAFPELPEVGAEGGEL